LQVRAVHRESVAGTSSMTLWRSSWLRHRNGEAAKGQ